MLYSPRYVLRLDSCKVEPVERQLYQSGHLKMDVLGATKVSTKQGTMDAPLRAKNLSWPRIERI